jgi:hypothetical protein
VILIAGIYVPAAVLSDHWPVGTVNPLTAPKQPVTRSGID